MIGKFIVYRLKNMTNVTLKAYKQMWEEIFLCPPSEVRDNK